MYNPCNSVAPVLLEIGINLVASMKLNDRFIRSANGLETVLFKSFSIFIGILLEPVPLFLWKELTMSSISSEGLGLKKRVFVVFS